MGVFDHSEFKLSRIAFSYVYKKIQILFILCLLLPLGYVMFFWSSKEGGELGLIPWN